MQKRLLERVEKIKRGEAPPNSSSIVLPVFGLVVGFLLLNASVGTATIVMLLCVALIVRAVYNSRQISRYDDLLRRLSSVADESLLANIRRSAINQERWTSRHRYIYQSLFETTLSDGISQEEKAWLAKVAQTLHVGNIRALHAESLKPILWGFFAEQRTE